MHFNKFLWRKPASRHSVERWEEASYCREEHSWWLRLKPVNLCHTFLILPECELITEEDAESRGNCVQTIGRTFGQPELPDIERR